MFITLKFFFRSLYVETVNNKCMRHNAIVLHVSHWPAYLGDWYSCGVWANDPTSLYVKRDKRSVTCSGLTAVSLPC